jgi:hypothetical protein
MRNLKVFLALGAGLVAAVAAACSSSSNTAAPPTPDAGDDSSSTDDGGPTSCLPIGTLSCAQGQTCCLDESSGLKAGVCEAPSACAASIQVGCLAANNCSTGQVCCANFGGVDAGTLAALEDGGLAALGIDASALSVDGGTGGLPSQFAGVTFKVTCEQTSCGTGEIQACASSAECVGGGSCVPLSALTGDAGIDAGAAGGLGGSLGSLLMQKACVPPDAGTTPPTGDDGGTDSGPTTVDAGTDAPAEAAP